MDRDREEEIVYGWGESSENDAVKKIKEKAREIKITSFCTFIALVLLLSISKCPQSQNYFWPLLILFIPTLVIFIVCSERFYKYVIDGYSVIYWLDCRSGDLKRRSIKNNTLSSQLPYLAVALGEHLCIKLTGWKTKSYYCPDKDLFIDNTYKKLLSGKYCNIKILTLYDETDSIYATEQHAVTIKDGNNIITHNIKQILKHRLFRIFSITGNLHLKLKKLEENQIELAEEKNKQEKLYALIDQTLAFMNSSSRVGKSDDAVRQLVNMYEQLVEIDKENFKKLGLTKYYIYMSAKIALKDIPKDQLLAGYGNDLGMFIATGERFIAIELNCPNEKMAKIWARLRANEIFKNIPNAKKAEILIRTSPIKEVKDLLDSNKDRIDYFVHQLPRKATAATTEQKPTAPSA